jgi:hypothetical protein
MVQFGAMVGALALQNRREKPLNMDAEAIRRRDSRARLLFVIAAGLLLVSLHTIASEYLERWMMYHSLFYQVTSGIFLFFLVVVARFVSIEMGSHGHHGRVYASDGLSGLGAAPVLRRTPLGSHPKSLPALPLSDQIFYGEVGNKSLTRRLK